MCTLMPWSSACVLDAGVCACVSAKSRKNAVLTPFILIYPQFVQKS